MENDQFNEEDTIEVDRIITLDDGNDEPPIDDDDEDVDNDGDNMESTVDDMSIAVFDKHKDQVFVVDCTVSGMVASGGKDDIAYVWNVNDSSVLLECKNHNDSVTHLCFNAKQTLLATGDISGLIQIWKLSDYCLLTSFQIGDLEWLTWHPQADVLFGGTNDGEIWMWLVAGSNPGQDCKVFAGEASPSTCGIVLPGGKSLLAGYADGTIKVWDLKTQTPSKVDRVHQSSVTCCAGKKDSPIGATGCDDGTVMIIQTETAKCISFLNVAIGDNKKAKGDSEETEDEDMSNGVETILFSSQMPFVIVGSLNGSLTFWDLNTLIARFSCTHPAGIMKVCEIDNGNIVSGCLDGDIREWDLRSGSLIKQLTGNLEEILDFCIAKNETTNHLFVLTAGADTKCRLFKLA